MLPDTGLAEPENPRTGSARATPRKRREEHRDEEFRKISRAFAVPGLLACALLAGTVLALTPGTSRGQDATDEWKVDPMRGPVDLGLTDPSLIGAIDVHLHLDPDSPGSRRRHPRDRRDRCRRHREIARHARLRVQDPSGCGLGGRRLSHPQALRADLRDFRPHGLELRDRRDQRRRAGALLADQGRVGTHLRNADARTPSPRPPVRAAWTRRTWRRPGRGC